MAEFFNVIMYGRGEATKTVQHAPARIGGKKTAPILGKDPKTGKFQLLPVPEGKGSIQFREGRTYQFPVGVRVPVTDEMKKIQAELDALPKATGTADDFVTPAGDPRPTAERIKLENQLKQARGRAVKKAIKGKKVDFPDGFKKVSVLDRSFSPDGSIVNRIESVTPVTPEQYQGVFKTPPSPEDPGDLLPEGDPEQTPKGRRQLEARTSRKQNRAARTSPVEEAPEVGGNFNDDDIPLDMDELAEVGTDADPDAKTQKSAYDRLSDDNKRRVNRGLVPIHEESGVEMDTTYMDDELKTRIDENASSRRTKAASIQEGRRTRTFDQRQRNVLRAIGSGPNTPKELRDRVAAYNEAVAKVKNSDLPFNQKQKALDALLVDLRQGSRRDLTAIGKVNKGQAAELERYRENIKRSYGQGNNRLSFIDRDSGRVIRPFQVQYESSAKPKKGDSKGPRGGKIRSATVFAESADEAMDRVSEIGDYVAAPGNRAGMVKVSQLDDANLDDITPGAGGSKPLVFDPETGDLVTDQEATRRSMAATDAEGDAPPKGAPDVADDAPDGRPKPSAKPAAAAGAADDVAGAAAKGGRISRALGIAGKTGLGRLGALAFGPVGTAVGLGITAYSLLADPAIKRREQAAKDRESLERYYQLSAIKQQQRFEQKGLQDRAAAARVGVRQKTRVRLSPELEAVLGSRREEFLSGSQTPSYKPDQLDMYRNLIR